MKYITEDSREVEVVEEPDVLVVGSGPAGVVAAIAAARMDVQVLLIERYGFLGGNMTCAEINPLFLFMDNMGKPVIGGIAQEIVDRLMEFGGAVGHVRDFTNDNPCMTPFDPEIMKYVLLKMVEESGCRLLLHAFAVNSISRDGEIQAVIIESKSGRQSICPKFVVDASGDADIAFQAGFPTHKGRAGDGLLQPASLFVTLGGVDIERVKRFMLEYQHLLRPVDENEIRSARVISTIGLEELVRDGVEKGEFPPDAAPRVLLYSLPIGDQVVLNISRIQGVDGTNVRDLTWAEVRGRQQVWQIAQFMKKRVPGFENSYILRTGTQVGIRETRRIEGMYTLTDRDLRPTADFDDIVALGAFAIDIHPPAGVQQVFTDSGRRYGIPYRTLVPVGSRNLIVAGRCISVTHEALGSIRVMATCMAMGQAAGTAAALALSSGKNISSLDIGELRQLLLSQGQILDL